MFQKILFVLSLFSLALMSFQSGSAKVPIFSDGFESGNFSAWSTSKQDAGDLAVTSKAALQGTKGMRALIDDNTAIFVQDNKPSNEDVYDIHFHFDPNSIKMGNLNSHAIFIGYDYQGTFVQAIRVELRYSNGAYQIRSGSHNDNLTWTYTAWFTISDAEHQIEVEWDAAKPGENDGKLKLKIDDVVRGNRIGLDNDTFRIDRIRLGAVSGIDAGTRGIYYFDQFGSFRD
jgi:hypothetical protein